MTVLNLLQKSNNREAKLISSFETIVKELLVEKPQSFNYAYFDAKKGGSIEGKSYNSSFFIEENLYEELQRHGLDCVYFDPNSEQRTVKS